MLARTGLCVSGRAFARRTGLSQSGFAPGTTPGTAPGTAAGFAPGMKPRMAVGATLGMGPGRGRRRLTTGAQGGEGQEEGALGLEEDVEFGRLRTENTVLMVCDMQDKFAPVIRGWDSAVHNTALAVRAAGLLGMPVVVTEQYPRGLGHTVAAVADVLPPGTVPAEKTRFSMVTEQVEAMLRGLPSHENVLLCGVETHVCVQQTALDLMSHGWAVHVLADATASQRPYDRATALRRIETQGGFITTVESTIFELLGDAKHPHFKAASQLVREARPDEALMWG